MTIENKWVFTGTVNPLKDTSKSVYKGTPQLKGWITQRDIPRLSNGDAVGGPKYIAGMNFTAVDPEIIKKIESMDNARQGAPASIPATFTGRITQWISKSKTPGGQDSFVYDLEVYDIQTL
jgi:hypothetical protein